MTLGRKLSPGLVGSVELESYSDQRELELTRQAVAKELRGNPGQEALAREIGVSRIVIRKFVDQVAVPTTENLVKIREWAENTRPVLATYGAVVLALAVAEVRGSSRADARRGIALALLQGYESAGVAVPEWLAVEAGVEWKPAAVAWGRATAPARRGG